jgi:hypothetical protein
LSSLHMCPVWVSKQIHIELTRLVGNVYTYLTD